MPMILFLVPLKLSNMTVMKLYPTLLLSIIKLTDMKVVMANPKLVFLIFPKFMLLVKYMDVVIVIISNQSLLFIVTLSKTSVSIKLTKTVVVNL